LALDDYVANRTGLLLVDPYNDFLSDGGKRWPSVKAVAEQVDLLPHLCAIVQAARHTGVVAPMMAIETVAAGGGSICRFDGVKLAVGPDSGGSDPGPAYYGRGGP